MKDKDSVEKLSRRIGLLVSRGRITGTDDSAALQLAQLDLLAREMRDAIERIQEYGFTSVPLAGAEAVALSLSGRRDHIVIVGTDDRRYRLKSLVGGEVALYTDEGDMIILRRGRQIEVNGGEQVTVNTKVAQVNATTKTTVTSPLIEAIASTQVLLDTPLVQCTGQLQVAGLITGQGGIALSGGSGAAAQITGAVQVTSGDVEADGISLQTHVHSDPQGGTTGGPQ